MLEVHPVSKRNIQKEKEAVEQASGDNLGYAHRHSRRASVLDLFQLGVSLVAFARKTSDSYAYPTIMARSKAEAELAKLKVRMSKLAMKIASESFGIELDYSPASMRKVERVLGRIHKRYVKSGDDEGLVGVAFEFAAYIVQVVEKNFGKGVWRRDHRVMGRGSLPFHWNQTVIFPFGWCLKRIFDGPGDDVWVKFNLFVVEEAQKRARRTNQTLQTTPVTRSEI